MRGLPVKFIQVVSLEPFPTDAIMEELVGVDKIIIVEENSFGTIYRNYSKEKQKANYPENFEVRRETL